MDGYITTTEAAAREGVSPQAIQKRIKRGSMAAIKVGTSWMVPATGWEPITVTVTGPSGCGKTRLAGAIADLWREQGGTVHRTERSSGYERLILSTVREAAAMECLTCDGFGVMPADGAVCGSCDGAGEHITEGSVQPLDAEVDLKNIGLLPKFRITT